MPIPSHLFHSSVKDLDKLSQYPDQYEMRKARFGKGKIVLVKKADASTLFGKIKQWFQENVLYYKATPIFTLRVLEWLKHQTQSSQFSQRRFTTVSSSSSHLSQHISKAESVLQNILSQKPLTEEQMRQILTCYHVETHAEQLLLDKCHQDSVFNQLFSSFLKLCHHSHTLETVLKNREKGVSLVTKLKSFLPKKGQKTIKELYTHVFGPEEASDEDLITSFVERFVPLDPLFKKELIKRLEQDSSFKEETSHLVSLCKEATIHNVIPHYKKASALKEKLSDTSFLFLVEALLDQTFGPFIQSESDLVLYQITKNLPFSLSKEIYQELKEKIDRFPRLRKKLQEFVMEHLKAIDEKPLSLAASERLNYLWGALFEGELVRNDKGQWIRLTPSYSKEAQQLFESIHTAALT
jgi:hypothetical protein